MPQFDFANYFAQVFWFLITFSAFSGFCFFFVYPKLSFVFSMRFHKIELARQKIEILMKEIALLETKINESKKNHAVKIAAMVLELKKQKKDISDSGMSESDMRVSEIIKKGRVELLNSIESERKLFKKAVESIADTVYEKLFKDTSFLPSVVISDNSTNFVL